MPEQNYDRTAAVTYAVRWAMGRNPRYYDFTALGGDCTNFVSQCLFAGAGIMNFTPVTGWYYRSLNQRAPAWTGVEALYQFLTMHQGAGPFARLCPVTEAEPGDVIQLGDSDGRYYHCLLVLRPGRDPLIAAHDEDSLWRPLSTYRYDAVRFLHITGVGR